MISNQILDVEEWKSQWQNLDDAMSRLLNKLSPADVVRLGQSITPAPADSDWGVTHLDYFPVQNSIF